jgi:hypothetical protein
MCPHPPLLHKPHSVVLLSTWTTQGLVPPGVSFPSWEVITRQWCATTSCNVDMCSRCCSGSGYAELGRTNSHSPKRIGPPPLSRGAHTRASAGDALDVSPLPPLLCGMLSGGPFMENRILTCLSVTVDGGLGPPTMGCVSSSSNQKIPAQHVADAKKLVQLFDRCYSAGEPR